MSKRLSFGPVTSLGLLLPLLLTATPQQVPKQPLLAHIVEIAEDVGATLHIEPNDNPRANVPALTWIALTRRGGQTIPLADCDCVLSVYALPRSEEAEPLLTPTLAAQSFERYQDIPTAEITFPEAGRYLLVLAGAPASETVADFTPFEFEFEVNVARGS